MGLLSHRGIFTEMIGGGGSPPPPPPPESWYDDPYIGWAADPSNPEQVTGHLADGPGNYQIIHVTTLARTGPGSFREALLTPGNRLIVFDVGGVCVGNGGGDAIVIPYNASNIYDNFTVCGKTAPYPGFHLERTYLVNRAKNCIWEHVGLYGEQIGDELGADGATIYNQHVRAIFDHCNIFWGADELLGCSTYNLGSAEWRGGLPGYYPYRQNFWQTPGTPEEWRSNGVRMYTITNNIIAEGIDNEPKGIAIADNANQMAIVKNLFHSGAVRQPRVDQGARLALVNNYIYNSTLQHLQMYMVHGNGSGGDTINWNDPAVYQYLPLGQADTEIWMQGGVVQNGPTSVGVGGSVWCAKESVLAQYCPHDAQIDLYFNDYISKYANGSDQPQLHSSISEHLVGSIPASAYHSSIVPIPASSLRNHISNNAGMRPWNRDPNSSRIITEMLSDGTLGASKASISPAPRLSDYGSYPSTSRTVVHSDWYFDQLPIQKKTNYID